MSTRERITFAENLTLVVMDVEPGVGAGAGEGVVWLELRDDRGPLKSSILGAGESFSYTGRGDGLNLTVTRIYAGGQRDLVELEIVSGVVVGRPEGDLANETDQVSRPAVEGDSSLLNRVLASLLALLLAAWVYFGARQRGR